MKSSILADIGQSIKAHPFIAVGGPTCFAAVWASYLHWQDVAPILQGLDATFAKLFGKDWLRKLLQSPYFVLLMISAVLITLWRSGNKISQREKQAIEIRKDERWAVQALPLEVMRIFWERELLRNSLDNISQCEIAINDAEMKYRVFKDSLPTFERPHQFRGERMNFGRNALDLCIVLQEKIGATVNPPVLNMPEINSSDPAPDVLLQRRHPDMQWFDREHNLPFFIAHEQNFTALRSFLQRLKSHRSMRERAANDASDALKRQYPFDGPPASQR